jgi:ketosteroid isomerase-like protein
MPWVAATLLTLAACAPKPETPEQARARLRAESDSVKTAIQAAESRLDAYLAGGKADSAALFYAEDATYSVVGSPTHRGRAAVAANFQRLMEMGSWTVTTTPDKVEASGPIAVESGHYVITFAPGPHAPPGVAASFPDTGAYVFTWRRADGTWLITNDIAVSTRTPAPARKR